jgi:electron transport complex protein RnfG
MSIVVGIDVDGVITGVEVVESSETAGLGSKATEEPFKGQFIGRNVEAFVVTKNGSTQENEVDAISGATITSNAVTDVVNASIYFINQFVE